MTIIKRMLVPTDGITGLIRIITSNTGQLRALQSRVNLDRSPGHEKTSCKSRGLKLLGEAHMMRKFSSGYLSQF